MAADQHFSKGRTTTTATPTTLRDELRGGGASHDDERASSVSKGSSRWKEMLGLRKALCVSSGGQRPSGQEG
ncbi:unnamed protein product [Miscanthus lutarioriparius]|uniref:Uncharacterized protein n=1 Tax=Miscanthus lutarioriparius TaxID=422564 RepID=A0A811NJP4_9POAL|nr:unnamed protein product [Miscanthus lutarioriparius]